MNNELLLPDTLAVQMQKRLVQLQATLQKIRETQKQMPQGHLRVAQKGTKRPWFYLYTKPYDLTGKYIRKKDIDFAKQLAQKDYNTALMEQLEKETIALQEYLTQSQNGRAIPKLYESLCPARQTLITPATLTDHQYIAQWESVTWHGRPFTENTPEFFTSTGVRVRSKSEVLIADALTRHKIPYRYEYPLKLKKSSNYKSSVILHPGFLCLNIRTRQEFYWEHFGLMDSPEYANNAIGKFRLFTENGITPGRNFIITMESKGEPLTTTTVETMIKTYLK